MDISFPDSSIDSDQASDYSECSSLLGECKEVEISKSEINELLARGHGDELYLDVCSSCASGGFKSANMNSNDKNGNSEERYTGVKAYSP